MGLLEAPTFRPLQQQQQQPESVSERPLAFLDSGGSIEAGPVTPGRSSLLDEWNPDRLARAVGPGEGVIDNESAPSRGVGGE